MTGAKGSAVKPYQLDWLLRIRHPAGAQQKYMTWLGHACQKSDFWALALYTAVCTVMSVTMLRKADTLGVPSAGWLWFGFLVRISACLGTLALLKVNKPFYLRWRTQLLVGAQLACHFSGLLLEAPATFWIQPAKEQYGFITPIVGQVFEVLGFRISFQWHLIRAVLDFAGSLASVCINVHLGWANSLHTRVGVTKHWEALFFLQYIVSGFGLMTGLMYAVERMSLTKFLRSADLGKLHGTDCVHDSDRDGAESSAGQVHLSGTLSDWAEAHKRWVPVCKTQVFTLKFNGPDFSSLTPSTCDQIRARLLVNRRLPSISSSVAFIEGCIQMIVRDHTRVVFEQPNESCCGSTLSGTNSPGTNDSADSGMHSQSGASCVSVLDAFDVEASVKSVPQEWLTSGTVHGYAPSLGSFEIVEENDTPMILPVPTSNTKVQVLSVNPPCVVLGEQARKLQLLCKLSPGDPIICLQDGHRVTVKVLQIVQVDLPEGEVVHQVTVDVNPLKLGYMEFYIVAKSSVAPTRIMDLDVCADIAYNAVAGNLAASQPAPTVISQPAPLLVLDDASACQDICSLVLPDIDRRSSSESNRSSTSSHMNPTVASAFNDCDSDDADSLASSRALSTKNVQRLEALFHVPVDTPTSGLQAASLESIKRFGQVAPTLTLCGVATSYFQLCSDSDTRSSKKRIELLASQDVRNMVEWQHLVESCILFMARNGLQHSTLYFLRKAAAFSSCGAMTNLLHYAVASGSVGLVRALVQEYGPSISKASDYGTTPVHLAAVIEHPDMLLALLEHPGNARIAMTVYDMSGKTAYNYACEAGLHRNASMMESYYWQHGQ